MPIVVPNASEIQLLNLITGVTPAEDMLLKLYTNDVTPGATDIAASYTEMTQHAYVAKTLAKASWSAVNDPTTGAGKSTYAAQTFTFTDDTVSGQVLVYGYYLVMFTSGTLLWAERFATTASVAATGDTISVTPTITLQG